MGEGVARAIAIVSIILTVASLALAVVFARKRSRIRVGFDLARAMVGIGAILVMAAVTNVATPTAAIVAAVVVGAGLGFVQGSSLEISPGERGFYAQRNPLGIVLWGVGIVIMQAAGMASRAGTVRIGQTIAWFSACLGIGLMVGRNGPLDNAKKALASAGAAVLAAVLVVPAIVAGTATPAVAQTLELTDFVWHARADDVELTGEQLCELLPWDILDLYSDVGSDDPQDALFTHQSGVLEYGGEIGCEYQFGGTAEGGWIGRAAVWQKASSQAAFDNVGSAAAEPGWGFLVPVDVGIGDVNREGYQGERFWTMAARDRFFFFVAGREQDGDIRGAMRALDAAIADVLGEPTQGDDGDAADSGDESSTPQEDPDSSSEPDVDSGAVDPASGDDASSDEAAERIDVAPLSSRDDDEPIEPENAAGQAIAGLIAAAAIGAITWAEAAAEIGQILGGLSSGGAPTTQTRTVVISGADAEAVINGGPGSSVGIPSDQQWDVNASVPGEPPITDGRVGSVGIVRSVGPIARGPDGTVSVSVEVDAFDPTLPPPIDLDPIVDTPPEPEMVPSRPPPGEAPPLPDIDEIYQPSPDLDPLPARPPLEEPPPLPDIDEIYEPSPGLDPLPPRPPGGELPPEGEMPPEPPSTPATDEALLEPPPLDETPPEPTPLDEILPEIPDVVSDVRLEPQEIDDIVRWGSDVGRPYPDIAADLRAANEAAGGSGSVDIPDWFHREYEDYAAALREIDDLRLQRNAIRDRMAGLERQAQRWSAWERQTEMRAVAGIRDVVQRQADYEALRAELINERARLESLPDAGTEIEGLDEQLAALEDDHRQSMSSSTRSSEGPVEPAEGADRGTTFDRPARELERIAREQDEMLETYRGLDERLEAAQRAVDEYEKRTGA